jgi:carbon monoxide dehydrogenase subunit G
MDFSGRYTIPASPEAVWKGLNDPEVLKACIPGCEELEKTSDTDFLATATLKIGPVKARFKGKVALSELEPPKRCVLTGEGQGGMAGFAKGGAEVLLSPEGTGTLLAYTAKASVGGKLAQIGQRLIDGAAKQIADDFFARFASVVGKSQPAAIEDALAAGAVASASVSGSASDGLRAVVAANDVAERRPGVSPGIWVIGLIGVVVILLVLFSMALPGEP